MKRDPIRDEIKALGEKAFKAGKPCDPPYLLSQCCTAIEVKAVTKARQWWIEGWNEAKTRQRHLINQ